MYFNIFFVVSACILICFCIYCMCEPCIEKVCFSKKIKVIPLTKKGVIPLIIEE